MTSRLYILGNGFDLAHGLKTSYKNFYAYLKKEHSNFLNSLVSFYPSLDDRETWNYFEAELSNLIVDDFIESFEGLNAGSDDFRDRNYHRNEIAVELELVPLYVKLKELFTNWIIGVSRTSSERKFCFLESDLFLSFNYTKTLEEVYGVDDARILHIHHKIGDTDLIFGHNYDSEAWKAENLPDLYEKEKTLVEDEGEYSYEMDYAIEYGCEAIDRFYSHTRKEPKNNIQEASDFFQQLRAIEEVVIMGSTLCNGDAEYIQHLTTIVNMEHVKWNLYYHKESEKQGLINILLNAGISPKNMTIRCSEGVQGRF